MAWIERTAHAYRQALVDAAAECGWDLSEEDASVGPPREAAHGDMASTAALALAGRVGEKPRVVAERLRPILHRLLEETAGIPVEAVEVAGPGFLNLRLAPAWLEQVVRDVLEEGEAYGRSTRMAGRRILFEFVSANPTGPLNVVSARAAAIGDAVAALWEAAGAQVGREFYINDAGRQVRLLGESLQARILEANGEESPIPEEGYHGEYLVELARRFLEEGTPAWWEEAGEARIEHLSAWAVERMVAAQEEVLTDYGLTFDTWFRESSLHASGAVEETLEDLRSRGCVFEAEGALWFRATDFGDDKDRVIVTSEGRPTYLLPDIAYHRDKFARGWSELVDLWGPDHHGYIARMKAGLQALGHAPEEFDVLIVQQVNLLRGGEVVKMSKRSGRLIEMAELLEEVGVDAARFLFLTRSINSHLDFDMDLAVSRSEENPVYYVQYAHARISSILEKAAAEGADVAAEVADGDLALLTEPEERALMRALATFPETVAGAAEAFEPHRIPAYLRDLAAAFHPFYHKHQVVGPPGGLQGARLALCQAVRTVLADGLGLLGVSAPSRM